MEHLLRIVEFLDVLCQAMFGRVDLATSITNQPVCFNNITVGISEIPFSKKHSQLPPDDATMILRKGDRAQLTWIGRGNMFAIVLQGRHMISIRLRMIITPVSHQSSVGGMKLTTNDTVVQEVNENFCIVTKRCNLMCSGILKQFLDAKSVFHLVNFLKCSHTDKFSVILESVPSTEFFTTSDARWYVCSGLLKKMPQQA